MIIINLIIDKSSLLQNYNKIFTKRTVFSIILQQNRDQNLHKKIRIFYAPQFFKGQNRKSVQITRANTVHLSVTTVVCFVMGRNGSSVLSIRFKCMSQKDLVGKKK